MNSDRINQSTTPSRLTAFQRLSRRVLAGLTLALVLVSRTAHAAPADENFDGVVLSGGYSFGASPRTINGWTFRLVDGSGANDGDGFVDVTNESGDTALANSASDKALLMGGWFNVAASARISTSNGSEFALVSFRVDNGAASSGNYRALGYRDGFAVTGASQNFSAATYADTLVTLSDAAWGNIDEFRIVRQDGSADVSFYIDDIDVSAAVIPNQAPTDIHLSNATVNQSTGVNAAVGTLSTTDADGSDTHTYSLVSGTGDTDNASFNILGTTLRANNASALSEGSYSIRIRTTDPASGTYEEAFTITIVDDVAPTVSDVHISISGGTGTGGAYKIGDTVTAAWDNSAFGDDNSDTITGVTVDFSQFGGAAAVVAANSSGTWTATYTITSGAIDASNRNISVAATDNAGNTATTSDTSNATVDNVAPTVASVTAPTNGTYRASVFLDFTVTFTDPVTVLGVPELALTVGQTARTATFHSGGGTTDLVFRHTVEVGDEDTDGVAVGALTAAGGTIRDAAANDAVLTLNNVASTAGVLVDGVAPLVSSVTRKTPLEQVTDATTVVFEVTFSEDMLNVDAAGFAVTPVNDGTVTANVTGVSGGPRIYDVTVLITGGLGEFRLDVNDQ